MLNIVKLKTIDSTNNWCRSHEGELPVAVIAEEQTAGRGRYGKTFCSPAGGAYLSYAFRASYAADDVQLLTLVAAAIVHQVLSRHCQDELSIKWVNDIYRGQRKIAGILCERIDTADGSGDYYIIVGVGVNVTPCELPGELVDIAGFLCNDGHIAASDIATEIAFALSDVLGKDENIPCQYIDYYKSHCYNLPGDAGI